MKIHFLGGAGTVTGSKFLVQTGSTQVLVDCGLFQGYKWLRERNWQTLPMDIDKLDAVILTHAHLDHSGYIPVMYKNGYRNPVFTHHATKDLCSILLPDSGHIQEDDARYKAKYKKSKNIDYQPLYNRMEAERCLEIIKPVGFEEVFNIGDIEVHIQSAGHILGAGSVIMKAGGKTIGFSGDVGRSDDVFMRAPTPLPELDLLLLESTYGNRTHDRTDHFHQLASIINESAHKGGALLIPSFAVGRAQTLMFMISELISDGRIPKLPVYLDSPMAINVSEIYCRFMEHHRLSKEQCHAMCDVASYTRGVEESKALAGLSFPHIIIAGSGMVTGGRILHHMKRLLGDYKTTVLFIGYQAGGTRGAKMQQGAEAVKIHGKWIPMRAGVEVLDGLSGHGDYLDIGQWLKSSKLRNKARIHLVHGDPDALEGMKDHLARNTSFDIDIAAHHEILTI